MLKKKKKTIELQNFQFIIDNFVDFFFFWVGFLALNQPYNHIIHQAHISETLRIPIIYGTQKAAQFNYSGQ